MAGSGPKVTLTFAGDASQLERTIGGVGKSVEGLDSNAGSRFEAFRAKATVAATLVGGALLGLAKVTGEAASEQEQALGGVEAVFKSSADQVKGWADNAAASVGLSKTAYLSLAAPVGASLKSVGMSVEEAADKTNVLIGRGADLAATFGGSTQEAVEAMGAALRGEFDPLERYGIALSASAVDAELAARGQDKLGGSALEAAKKQATMDLILRQSSDAAGQFAREGDTAAGAQERFNATLEDAKASLGQALLPLMSGLATSLKDVATWAQNNTGLVQGLAIGLGVLAGGVFLLNGAMAAWRAATTLATAAQWLLNTAMLANPITWIVLGIALIVGAFIYLWNTSEGFRNFWIGLWEGIKSAFGTAWDWIKGAFDSTVSFIGGLPGRIGGFLSGLPGMIGGFFQRAAAAAGQWAGNLISQVGSWLGSLPGRIVGWLGGIGNQMLGIGRNIIDGIWRGLQAGWSWLTGQIGNLARSLLNAAKSALGISSPSKAFRREFGEMLPKGAALGVEDGTPELGRAVRGMADQALGVDVGTLQRGSAPAGAGSPGVLRVEFVGNTDSAFSAAFMKLVRSGQIRVVAA